MTRFTKSIVIIQAHAYSFEGTADYSLRRVDGVEVIRHLIRKIKSGRHVANDCIIIACTLEKCDDVYMRIASEEEIECFRGGKEDVLGRLMCTADHYKADHILHVMGQHMFQRPSLFSELMHRLIQSDADIVCPPIDHDPMQGATAFRRSALDRAAAFMEIAEDELQCVFRTRPLAIMNTMRDIFDVEEIPKNETPLYANWELEDLREKAKQIFTEELVTPDPQKGTPGSYYISQYTEAASFLSEGDKVFDAGCGTGYGTVILSESCDVVTGCDADIEAVIIAERLHGNNAVFGHRSSDKTGMMAGLFNAVVSIETTEHLGPEGLLWEVWRLLAKGGKFICTAPQNFNGRVPINPHHKRQYSAEEFRKLIEPYFEIKSFYGSYGGVFHQDERGTGMMVVGIKRDQIRG